MVSILPVSDNLLFSRVVCFINTLLLSFIGNRVITAGIKGMTTGDPPDTQTNPPENTESLNSFVGVLRTCRRKATG